MTKEVNRRLAALESQAAERVRRACLTSSPYSPEEAYALMCAPGEVSASTTDTRSPMEQYMAILNGPTR